MLSIYVIVNIKYRQYSRMIQEYQNISLKGIFISGFSCKFVILLYIAILKISIIYYGISNLNRFLMFVIYHI